MKEIALRGRAYPSDLNYSGTVFGGWIMAKMDKAASIAVEDIVDSGAVTVSVSNLHFLKPINNGDIVTIYTEITKIGTTSMEISVEVMLKCNKSRENYAVTEATFTFVTVNSRGEKVKVKDVLRKDFPSYINDLLKK